MGDLTIDLDMLAEMQSELKRLRAEFEHAEQIGDAVAGYTGHPGLEGVVRDFAGRWSIRRGQLLDRLDYIASAVEAIHDTMLETDARLAESLAIPAVPAPKE